MDAVHGADVADVRPHPRPRHPLLPARRPGRPHTSPRRRGGALADRLYKPSLIFATQAAFLVNAVLLAALAAGGGVGLGLVLGLQVLNGVVQAVDLPARLAMVPDLVPRDDLVNAVGLNSLVFNSARAVGPALAGLVFEATAWAGPAFSDAGDRVRVGAAVCFALNAVSFVAVLAALRAIRYPAAARPHEERRGSTWGGVRYLATHPRLGGLVLLTLVVCVFGWPLYTLLPAYTRDHFNREVNAYSALLSGLGAGALVAALATATFGGRRRRGPSLLAGVLAAGAGLWGLTLDGGLGPAVLCTACSGFGLILYLSTGQSALQLSVPDEMRGRVMALWAMTLSASAPVGHLIAGQMAAAFGVVPVLRVMAAGVLLAAAGLGVWAVRVRVPSPPALPRR